MLLFRVDICHIIFCFSLCHTYNIPVFCVWCYSQTMEWVNYLADSFKCDIMTLIVVVFVRFLSCHSFWRVETPGSSRKSIKPMFIQIDSRISILNKSFESIVSIKIKISFSGSVQQMKQDTNQVEFNLNMKNWEYKSNICVCLEIYFNISFIFIFWKVFAPSIEPYSLFLSLSKVG